jgi:hypothetical protein
MATYDTLRRDRLMLKFIETISKPKLKRTICCLTVETVPESEDLTVVHLLHLSIKNANTKLQESDVISMKKDTKKISEGHGQVFNNICVGIGAIKSAPKPLITRWLPISYTF